MDGKRDHSMFDRMFDDTKKPAQCVDCFTKDAQVLQPHGGTSGGSQLWIYADCKASRDQREAERTGRIRASVEASARHDAREER